MPEITTNLFVYGTLMFGGSNYRQIESFVVDYKPGTIDGVLVDLGAYPALIEGEGIVKGIVLEIDADAIEITDRIEGFQPDRSHSLYLRQQIIVQLETKEKRTAWTYLFANPDVIANSSRLVVDEIDGTPIFAWRNDERQPT